MRKSKGQTVDLLYSNQNNKKSSKPKSSKSKASKKTSKTKKNSSSEERINLDNEIIIGLTPKKENNDKGTKSKSSKKKNNKKSKIKNEKQNTKAKKTSTKVHTNNGKAKKVKKENPNRKRNLKIIKWITIIMLFIVAVILFMMSSVFNIKKIEVVNNSKISAEEIINLSGLTTGVNMFKTTNWKIRSNIKTNAYIENVNIKRNINGTVTLDITERKPTYMIKFEDKYVYINNQGYMLEISEKELKVPIIEGFLVTNEEFIVGNRLAVEDLNKLDDIIKIIEASKNTSFANLITKINISDDLNYKLTVSSQNKIIELGDMTNINIKLQMADAIMSREKGKKGEIYFQDNSKRAIFKEEVKR